MRECVLPQLSAFLLRSTLWNRAAVVLTCAIVGLMVLAVGLRLSIHARGAGAFDRIHALTEDPSLERVSLWGGAFLSLTPVPRGGVPAQVLFSNEGTRHDLSTSSLAGVMLCALPFAALLVGVGMSPPRGGANLTLLSAPVRRTTFYLAHMAALLCYVAVVMAIGWGLCSLLIASAGPSDQPVQQQLNGAFAYSSLYAAVYGSVGLWFGVWFRKRSVAMLAGMALIVILIGVLPNLGELLTGSYFDVHPELAQLTRDTGNWPDNPIFLSILAVRHAPGNALQRILREIADPTPTTLDRTCLCRVAWSSAGIIAEETIALGAALLVAFLVGMLVFVRREPSEP
jgi:hypothetical protein